MEPSKGGSLANFSDDINAKFRGNGSDKALHPYALRWVETIQCEGDSDGMSPCSKVEDKSEDIY